MKKIVALVVLSCLNFMVAFAQGGTVEMATGLRSSGKIYVVVLVLAVIFIGFIVYLIRIDQKVSRLEKRDKYRTK